ncbi:hypothetical protein [Catelliglobosispora koreensis]|uniref:hypothetical protein n=1 Tax=Catelliglobosispora koreensis TaxID=129052 RepID=UPI00039DCE99|nr:hypothetical protein [Catelliglobosispora koreensis]
MKGDKGIVNPDDILAYAKMFPEVMADSEVARQAAGRCTIAMPQPSEDFIGKRLIRGAVGQPASYTGR